MHAKQQSRPARLPVLQVATVASVVLLALAFFSQRAPAAVQTVSPHAGQYVTDLQLPLDVGTLEQQVSGAPTAAAPPRRQGGKPPRLAAATDALHAAAQLSTPCGSHALWHRNRASLRRRASFSPAAGGRRRVVRGQGAPVVAAH